MFGLRNSRKDNYPDLHQDQKKKRIFLYVVFGIFAFVLFNFIMFYLTKI